MQLETSALLAPIETEGAGMDGENVEEQKAQGEEGNPEGDAQAQGAEVSGAAADGAAAGYEAQIAERDEKIAALEAQVADAAKTAEAAEGLRAEIAELKEQAASERVEFELRLAGARNVKAAATMLSDYEGDVGALKAAEPWMFDDAPAKQAGKTGLPNAGASGGDDAQMKRFRRAAGLDDED